MKSMITAIGAAAAVFAASTAGADALVYEFSATLKTTVAQSGKIGAGVLTCTDETVKTVYRKQGTIKLGGVIWGCDCSALAAATGYSSPTEDGCIFWNATDKKIIDATLAVKVLNRFNSNGKDAEGAWTLENDCWFLVGGGFGSIKTDGKGDEFTYWLNSLSGNVAGWRCAPGITARTGKDTPCTYCNPGSSSQEETTLAIAWTLCDCGETDESTAVSGTWNLKYNKSATKKLNAVTSIFDAYKFPSWVKTALGAG